MFAPVCPLRLKKGREADIRRGMPWIYAGDIIESSELMLAPPGSLVTVETHKGDFLGIGYANPKSRIMGRVLTLKREPIDTAFFKTRLEQALARREKLGIAHYCRLVHSEADALPGLLIDRFGDHVVIQPGTAGMERLMPLWREALDALLSPAAMVLRGDTPARALEGLKQEVVMLKGEAPHLVEVEENGCVYYADLLKGQKTGWFYDQRDNRRLMAGYAKGKSVTDVYSHSGGFGVLAALSGASRVVFVDSSQPALDLAMRAARRNGVADRCEALPGEAFTVTERLAVEGQRFDIVLADPPAFVKSRKDFAAGLKGYEKVARLAAALVEKDGLLFVASCSHHAARAPFNRAVLSGVEKAGRRATLLKQTGAGGDHPVHPLLPQSEYLKGILLKMTP